MAHVAAWILSAAVNVSPAAEPPSDAIAAPSLVVVNDTRRDVPLTAANLEDVVALINSREAVHEAGKPVWFRTEGEIRVGYRLEPTEPGCRIVGLVVSLDLSTVLPEWQPSGAVRPGVMDRWEIVRVGMEAHEQGHRDNALAAAETLAAKLHALVPGPQDDCADIDRAILRERIKAQMIYESREVAYDRRTRHGATQTRLPADSPPEDEDKQARADPYDTRRRWRR